MEAKKIGSVVSTSEDSILFQSILFCGDFCPINRASYILAENTTTSLLGDFQPFLKKAAITIANLEAPFRSKNSLPINKAGPSISISEETVSGISKLGFSAFGLANNHILDYGESSLANTQSILRDFNISSFGAGNNSALASKPFTFKLAGKSVAVIGAADKEFSAAGKDTPGAYCPSDAELALYIADCAELYDHIILYYHGGNEYYRYPSPELVAKCHLFVQSGASAVICHHSHVPGAVEFYQDAPIVYGLGNFVFDRGLKRPKEWYLGYAASLTLNEKDTFNLVVIPYEQFTSAPTITLLSEADSEDFSLFLKHQQMIIADSKLLADEWSKWCDKNRQEYIGRLLGMNRLAKKLFKILKYPLLRLSFQKKLYIYNLIKCSAHREVLLTLLSDKDRDH